METNNQINLEVEGEVAEDRFLVFTIDERDYAIEIKYTIEIIEVQPITEVPFMSQSIKGIINLRGSVIPIMDVRLRFGLMEQEHTDRTCIIVINNNGVELGLIVDAVQEVLDIPEENRMPLPSDENRENARYIKGVGNTGNGIQLLLNCDQLMDIHEF